jgi:prepilin-type N-terminal cleavage/methylation domain-containing protein
MRETQRQLRRQRRQAFTLVELLTVVAIIGLLVTLIVPTLRAAYQSLLSVQTRVRIENLANGCELFRNEKSFYPMQDSILSLGTKASGKLAGCLFTDANGNFPASNYSAYENNMLGWVHPTSSSQNDPNAILDPFSDRMAILYFPYDKDNNRFVASGTTFTSTNQCNYSYITTTTVASAPYSLTDANMTAAKKDRFLLIGAGKNRLYGDSDDVKNWSN